MSRFVLALAAAALSTAAVQDEMVDNPEYKGWKGQKVGAWVKFKMSNDMNNMKMEGETTSKLKEITAEKAVVDQTTIVEMMGQKHENTRPRTVPAKIKKGTDSDGGKVEIVAEGDEELTIKDKKVKCHWVQMKVTNKMGEQTIKNWQSDQVVGGTAKMEMSAEKPMKMTATMTVVDWKAGE
jgi:hypothetical protein